MTAPNLWAGAPATVGLGDMKQSDAAIGSGAMRRRVVRYRFAKIDSALLTSKPPGGSTARWVTLPSCAISA